jgi:16S rRNA (adenine1518-N6/adenine1519-N6)-dimethyltransferase
VRLVPKASKSEQPSFETVEKVTAAAFGQRRKMIRGSLKEYMPFVQECGLREEARAEELTIDEFVALARLVTKARL